ncbi:MAG: hypothetical protein H3Z52_14105, partial [archaeon]|nr:hypothetical protein [archaeon]MCP8322049.1 hypothetical protein [archaeon]
RISVMIGLWLVGFVIGFIGFLLFSVLVEALANFLPFLANMDSYLLRATLSGFVGSIATVIAVVVWGYSSKRY